MEYYVIKSDDGLYYHETGFNTYYFTDDITDATLYRNNSYVQKSKVLNLIMQEHKCKTVKVSVDINEVAK